MARWKLCASTTFEILPLSTCSLCQQKSHISKSIQRIFEIFASARRCWEWAFGWKVSGAQVFYFCNGKAKTLNIENIWNFATFNLYTVPAKILYLQWYSTDFRNLRLELEDVEGGAFGVKRFSCAGILLLAMARWKVCTSTTFEILPTFNLYTVAAKIPISPKVFNRFSKSLPELEDAEEWAFGWNSFRFAGILLLQSKGENFGHRQHLKFCHFQLVHFGSKNSISPKVFKWSSKSLPELEDVEGGHFGGMFQVRRCFTFVMARWKLWASTTFEFLPLSTCTLYTVAAKILYLQKYSTNFRNLCLSS